MPDLSLGLIDDSVGVLQTKLQQRGLLIPMGEAARNYFGPGTRQAVFLFQKERSLPVTGVVDEQTAAALDPRAGDTAPITEAAAAATTEPACGAAGERCGEDAPTPQEPVNKTCPWSGKPVHLDALMVHQNRLVGFCSTGHRDRFKKAIEHFETQKTLKLAERTCPWSGKPVQQNATLDYGGHVVGFCSPAHRDQFKKAVDHFAASVAPEMSGAMLGASDSMSAMEEVVDTTVVPPLLDGRILQVFCQAVQSCADGMDLHDQAAAKLSELQAQLTNLQNLASLCRLAVVGHPLSFARVVDEMCCLAQDFPCEPLKEPLKECERDAMCIVPDNRGELTGLIDMLAGATFVSKDDPSQRDRFVVGIVRAVEHAIAFPVTFAPEAATYIGAGTGQLSPSHAAIVIGNATLRLINSDRKCIPRLPDGIHAGIERLASEWARANPVTAFFEAISGPKVHKIVHWEDPSRACPCDAIAGDPVTLLVSPEQAEGCLCADVPCALGVMFSPHEPAEIVRVVENGLQVRVPQNAQTGPVAVVRRTPDFSRVDSLLTTYSAEYPTAMNASIFSLARIDKWAFPFSFCCPVIKIAQTPANVAVSVYTTAGPLGEGQSVPVNETVAIHYSVRPGGCGQGALPTVSAPGGVVTVGSRPGVLLYQPSAIGAAPVQLTWGSLKVTVPISVTGAVEADKASA